jgi:uncharacterized protein
MTHQAQATVATKNASRYLQQLCKHWSHKFEVSFDSEQGQVSLPIGTATMRASPDLLYVTIETDQADSIERLKQVVATHLDRFAFKEAPLPFIWN